MAVLCVRRRALLYHEYIAILKKLKMFQETNATHLSPKL